jgi:hypothetical protein
MFLKVTVTFYLYVGQHKEGMCNGTSLNPKNKWEKILKENS